jgi:hypothetical protein
MSKRRRGKAISRKWRENEARRRYLRIVRGSDPQQIYEALLALFGSAWLPLTRPR